MNNYNASEGNSIPSPYNFVPLSNKIVEPDWAPMVSHDIPFEDGLSGELDVKLEAMSPFYVRNGGAWDDKDKKDRNSQMHEFFKATTRDNADEDFIIPGSSIKGVLRSVLEIVSFSKMSRISDNRYSLRDLNNKSYTSELTSKKNNIIVPLSQSGWLTMNSGRWFLTPCSYARIEHSEIKKIHSGFPTGKCSAVDKYNEFSGGLNVQFTEPQIEVHEHRKNKRGGPIFIKYSKISGMGQGDKKGTLVFTGQPGGTKHMEFVFYDEGHIKINVDFFKQDFEFIHSKQSTEKRNEEWKYWNKILERGGKVPVFYLTTNKEEASDKNLPDSFGLAMMYRLPYALTIGDTIRNTNKAHFPRDRETYKLDMADLIFGYVHNHESLKGRVQISHFHETIESKNSRGSSPQDTCTTILGSPKPTYYPNYLVQKSENGKLSSEKYKTYMDKAIVRGWKRYPVRSRDDQPSLKDLQKNQDGNDDTAVFFRPLPKGSTFAGKIRFHNLKPEELGALLWVLNWGGNGNCHHQVGMAKPLGFGRVKFSLDMENSRIIHPRESSIPRRNVEQKFIDFMKKNTGEWIESKQLTQLLAMADNSRQDENTPLEYPVLSVRPNKNDFSKLKKDRMVLRSYSGSGVHSRNKHSPRATTNNKGKAHTNIVYQNGVERKESTTKDSSFECLLSVAKRIKDKELKKKMMALDSISRDDLNRLRKALTKRNNWNTRKILKGGYNWLEALDNLESKVKAGDEN